MIDPATGRRFGQSADSTEADVDAAVHAARSGDDKGGWGWMPAFEHGRILHRVSELIWAQTLAVIEARDTGKCSGAGAGIELSFGGTGTSGHGPEKGESALHNMREITLIAEGSAICCYRANTEFRAVHRRQ